MAKIPERAKVGFWTAIGVFAALFVWKIVESRLP
jgi:hypothetical protein